MANSPSSAENALRFKATHDKLTGFLNREGLDERLQNLIERPGRFGVIVIDLDGLKKTNDANGHASGDELLVRAAQVSQAVVRHHRPAGDNDILAMGRGHNEARTGGDEFVLLFPGARTEEDMQTIQERLRQNFETAGIGVSMGGQLHHEGMAAAELLHQADLAMYANKQQRKLERYAPEQLEVIEHLGSVAALHEIDVSDLPAVLTAIKNSRE